VATSADVGGRIESDTLPLHEDRRHGTLQVADSHGAHSRLDTRTLCHTALVNRESSCRLSSAEMVASGSGWGIGWMGRGRIGRSQHHFSIVGQSRRLGREMLAIARLTALRRDGEGQGGFMRSTVSFYNALGLAIME